MSPHFDLGKVLDENRIVLCGGTGGVGKTTTAAALGLMAAARGRRTLVLTIDPARRLADAMGLESLTAKPQTVPGNPDLHAMMLDPGSSLDELITRHARNDETAAKFLASPYYQQISRTVAGSREFVAMEKINELAADASYDLLIVDTPPSQHALDFIDAPARMLEILDGSGFGLLLRANNLANRLTLGLAGKGQRQFAKLFQQLTGHSLMLDINIFFEAYGDIIEGFKSRAQALQARLRQPGCVFLLIMTPTSDVANMAGRYLHRLHSAGIRAAGGIFNQVIQTVPDIDRRALEVSADGAVISADLLDRLLVCHDEWLARSHHDQAVFEKWQSGSNLPYREVPRLARNVSSQADLQMIVAALSS